ncbi:FGGY-family carbohydrate kinase [Pantoea sp. SM3]|uniref:FGGY-family carbohydrate kinase n=1 Tax=Pantoea sp. SM3 TaxID=1628192 RepID=UPI0005F78468|nr:FGGY-family carbohydrate kinase [Pantoea sp. SM3]KJV34698.1 sugar kinase [Pantoea sp. SM3]
MSARYLMGIDVGTQSAKVVIFRTDGEVMCSAQQPLRALEIPQPNRAEHPDDDLWHSVQQACRAAMTRFHQFGGQDHQLLAAGLCVIRCCRVLMRQDGELAWPVINWMDVRLNQPYQPEPEYGEVRWVTTTSGYITHRLTGQARDTSANYIGCWPMNDARQTWDDNKMASCHVRREQLFDVVRPGEMLGEVTSTAARASGLPLGLPIIATAHDKAVEALGAGALAQGEALISLGTYIGAMVHGDAQPHASEHFWPFQAALPGHFLYECMGVRRGMWTVSWFRDQFGAAALQDAQDTGVDIETLLGAEASLVPAGSDGLITLHDWAAPAEAPWRKGAIIGFDGRHTRAHLFRSLLEGIVFTMKNHLDPMMQALDRPLTQLVISGGGANSDLFMQLFADIFGVPARRNAMRSSAAIGCALNAGMALGVWQSYQEGVAALVKTGETFLPNARHHALYQQLNQQVYQQLHRALDPLLKRLSPLVEA